MKNRTLLFSFALLPLVAFLVVIATQHTPERSYSPRFNMQDQSVTGAAEYWKIIRNNQITGEVDVQDVQQALLEIKQLKTSKTLSWTWDEMGPDNLGGRTRAILFDKDNPTIMYAGSVSGGLWKSTTSGSTWVKVTTISDNLIIASITQAPNGDIYVGTGEGFYPGTGDGTRGFNGIGIYKSSDGGQTFSLLSNTSTWTYINEMAVDKNNGYVYAATKAGLKISSDGGATWSVTPTPLTITNSNADDVDIATDGTVVLSINKACYIATNGVDFVRRSGGSLTLPNAGSRMELAIAPSDPNYIYASLAASNESTQGVFRSVDKGETWTQIAPAATTGFAIHGSQGSYNNTIEVFPDNKDKILVGGINIWTWSLNGTWTQITSGSFSESSPLYVHVDIHEFAFHPTNPDIVFVGCDGGIHRSLDGGVTWNMMNKNYSTIQYYAITSSGSGQILGGTQDNSYQFVDFKGNTPRSARQLWINDGGYAAISQINPEAYFVSGQYGLAARTATDGEFWQKAYNGTSTTTPDFFSSRMLSSIEGGTPGTNFSHFVTPLILWESVKTFDSKDSIMFIADTNYIAGEVISVRSHKHNGYPFKHTLLAGLNKGDSMLIQNPIQSVFVIAGRTSLWMTREAIDFSGTPTWWRIGSISGGIIQTIAFSADGDHIFAGTTAGGVFRFSNIHQAYDSTSADISSSTQVITRTQISTWSGRAITSIAVDPLDNDHVVVTLGNYGNTNYVYRTTNATDATPTFTSKQGTAVATKLPTMPVYSSLIPLYHPKMLIVGTEFGTYICEDITKTQPVWVEANQGMDRVPTLMLHQQVTNFPYTFIIVGEGNETALFEYNQTTNYGGIYAGTHGRGGFRNLDFVNIEKPVAEKPSTFRSNLLIYPNPVEYDATVVFNLNAQEKVTVRIFDITGKLIASTDAGWMHKGRNVFRLEMSHLKRGNYMVQVLAGNESRTSKVIKK